jgi:hypothetical protein
MCESLALVSAVHLLTMIAAYPHLSRSSSLIGTLPSFSLASDPIVGHRLANKVASVVCTEMKEKTTSATCASTLPRSLPPTTVSVPVYLCCDYLTDR